MEIPTQKLAKLARDGDRGKEGAWRRELLANPQLKINAVFTINNRGQDVIEPSVITHGETLLTLACLNRQRSIVRQLLETPGIDVNQANQWGFSPLMMAAYGKLALRDKAQHLPESGHQTVENYLSRLERKRIGLTGDLQILRQLLEVQGIDIELEDGAGHNVLTAATIWRLPEIVKALLESPKVVSVDSNYQAWFHAVKIDAAPLAQLFLASNKFDLNIQDREMGDWTVIRYAIAFNSIAVAKLLLEQPSLDINAKDILGETLLHYMAARPDRFTKWKTTLMLILAHSEIQLDQRRLNEDTALVIALRGGNQEFSKALILDERTSLNEDKNAYGMSPLCLAARLGDQAAVKLMLDQPRAHIQQTNRGGANATYMAAKSGNVEVLRLMLAAGGDGSVEVTSDLDLFDGLSPPLTAPITILKYCLHPEATVGIPPDDQRYARYEQFLRRGDHHGYVTVLKYTNAAEFERYKHLVLQGNQSMLFLLRAARHPINTELPGHRNIAPLAILTRGRIWSLLQGHCPNASWTEQRDALITEAELPPGIVPFLKFKDGRILK